MHDQLTIPLASDKKKKQAKPDAHMDEWTKHTDLHVH